ncbi:MAG: hypothetical protein IJQ77_06935 [Synergistaceae bacterium]|nr:hypothetical protein [Synergistaceae bacterium]
MSLNRYTGTRGRSVNPYEFGRNPRAYYEGEDVSSYNQLYYNDEDDDIYPEGNSHYDDEYDDDDIYRDRNSSNYGVYEDEYENDELYSEDIGSRSTPSRIVIELDETDNDEEIYPNENGTLSDDLSDEESGAAWVDDNGLVPQIRLGNKLYYLNRSNWNWLMREASSGNNREMLRAGIRNGADLSDYISSRYPELRYLNREEPTYDDYRNLPPLSSRNIRSVNSQSEGSSSRHTPNEYEYMNDDEDVEYRAPTPKKAYRVSV